MSPLGDLRPRESYRLPDAMRSELAKPLGPVVAEDALHTHLGDATTVLAVGDVVSLTLKRLGIRPKLFIVDFRTQRGAESKEWRSELGAWGRVGLMARNPAGSVTREAWDAVRRALWVPESPVRIVIEGEEDLLGIPCILEAPGGAKVLYGIPDRGVCVVTVTEELQDHVAQLVGRLASQP